MSANNHQILEVGAGESIVDGKTHWTDFIEVRIADREAAFDLAMDILRQYDQSRFRGSSEVSINLTGILRSAED